MILDGRGDSPAGYFGFRNDLGLASVPTLLLQAPDPYFTGFSWYDLPPDQGPGIRRSRELLAVAFDRLATFGQRADRTFLLGFSQGCLMTLEFGARHPERLAGYVGISGYAYDPDALLREASPAARAAAHSGDWIVTHGTEDDVLDVVRTRAQMETLNAGAFPIDYREYRKAHAIDPVRELPDLRAWFANRLPEVRSPKK